MTPGELIAAITAHHRATVTAAWWREYFARERQLRPLRHYLPSTSDQPAPHAKSVEERRKEYEELKDLLG